VSHHKLALLTITVSAVLDVLGGFAFAAAEHISNGLGIYWAVTTATTSGYGDVVPHTAAGHIIAVAVMITVIPLFSATFSLFTSGLAAIHIRRSHEALKQHVTDTYRRESR
jgi:voltage-gated potassium channel